MWLYQRVMERLSALGAGCRQFESGRPDHFTLKGVSNCETGADWGGALRLPVFSESSQEIGQPPPHVRDGSVRAAFTSCTSSGHNRLGSPPALAIGRVLQCVALVGCFPKSW